MWNVNADSFEFKHRSSLDLTSVRIEGDRITLVPISESHAADIFKEFTSEITRYMLPKAADIIDETLSFISDSIEGMRTGRELVLAITRKESGEFLGCCGLHGKGEPRTPELGIWLKKDVHGNRYGLETIEILSAWAVENTDFDYLIYPVDKANTPSRKIPEKLGGTIYRERSVETMSGGYLDEVVYRVSYEILKQYRG